MNDDTEIIGEIIGGPPRALTRADLDMVGCSDPDCPESDPQHNREVWLHPGCHPESPTWAMYSKDHGAIHLYCGKCNQPVGAFLIAMGTVQ